MDTPESVSARHPVGTRLVVMFEKPFEGVVLGHSQELQGKSSIKLYHSIAFNDGQYAAAALTLRSPDP